MKPVFFISFLLTAEVTDYWYNFFIFRLANVLPKLKCETSKVLVSDESTKQLVETNHRRVESGQAFLLAPFISLKTGIVWTFLIILFEKEPYCRMSGGM